MKTLSIIVTFFTILATSVAAPPILCSDSNSRPLGPSEKAKLETFLANSEKYSDYYDEIRKMPCFDQELQKLYYLIDPSWDELLIEETTLPALSPLCKHSTDANSRPLVAHEKDQLEKFLSNSERYADYYETIRKQPCFEQELQNLYYLIDTSLDEFPLEDKPKR